MGPERYGFGVKLDPDQWGPEPSQAELEAAARIGEAAVAQARRSLPSDWDRDADGRPLPHLADVRGCYPGTDLAFAVWMTTPNADLGGVTPAQALKARRRAAVV